MEIQINFLGLSLLVNGNYTEEEGETNSGADFEITSVYLENDNSETDIFDLVEDKVCSIKDLVIEKIEE